MMTHDMILESFLTRQMAEGAALSESSDLITVLPMDPQRHVVVLRCAGLVMQPGGRVEESRHFEAGIYFGPDHLRRLDPGSVITWFGPDNVWHPNIAPRHHAVCVGHMAPGVSLVELVYQLFEIVTWRRVTLHDALNPEAAQWARNNRHRYPVDTRPLRRRALPLKFQPREAGAV